MNPHIRPPSSTRGKQHNETQHSLLSSNPTFSMAGDHRATKRAAADAAESSSSSSRSGGGGKRRRVLGDLTNVQHIRGTGDGNSSGKNLGVVCKEEVKKAGGSGSQAKSNKGLMYEHLRMAEIEENARPLPKYMKEVQTDLSPNMRAILIDWLVEVADKYRFASDTLYRAVSYIDRFLSATALKRNKLQLLGATCMFIASKYEDVCTPHVEEFCYIMDCAYSKEEMIIMENDVCKSMNYKLSLPTIRNFLRNFTTAAQEIYKYHNVVFEFLCVYLAELSLFEYGCLEFLPSVIAASAVFLARFTIQPEFHPWSLELQAYSGYGPCDLKECVVMMHRLQLTANGRLTNAIKEKYSQPKFCCVASMHPPSEIPTFYLKESGQ